MPWRIARASALLRFFGRDCILNGLEVEGNGLDREQIHW
jgi:hypothetical protein